MKANLFVDELVAAMPTPQAKLLLIARLVKYAGMTIYIPTESKKARRVRAAANMRANGMSAADAANAIIERFGVALRTAQRDVEAARKSAQKNDVFTP
jgi:hypothetical protein